MHARLSRNLKRNMIFMSSTYIYIKFHEIEAA